MFNSAELACGLMAALVASSGDIWEGVRALWAELTLVAVIDILIVAFLLYQLVALVRSTRASQVLLGIGLMVLLYYAARWWQLHTLHWLLTTLLPYLVFAIIVIFQAEIRQGLARLGRNPLLPRFSRLSRGFSYDDILLAVSLFSSQKIGALMVLERDISLRSYIDSGIGLDAQLSYDLLVTIFRPGAPLHDGAVIVQKERLAAAACFLPLSVNPALSTQVGTRHRAALGVTEETDAVAVAVSEQTGSVSLAVSGAIEQNISLERLRARLSELFATPISPSALPTTSLVEEAAATAAAGGVAGARAPSAPATPPGGAGHSGAADSQQSAPTPSRTVQP